MQVSKAIELSKSYLSTTEALGSIQRDPYWPKWNSPWWHMLLLFELGLAKEIPSVAIEKMVNVLKKHYLPIFPIREREVPSGVDPRRHIACFCAVGSIYQVLFAAGVNVDQELPWMREWFLKYQLPDGGLNCDESSYLKDKPKSSIVSTLPCLEAVLFCRKKDLTAEEIKFLNSGADYLVRQRLIRRVSTGEVIDKDWTEIRFPRFYDYDYLRGYYFLAKWSELSGYIIPQELTSEVKSLVALQTTDQGIILKRYNLIDKRSYNPINDSWEMGPISEFELMKTVSYDGALCNVLTKQWQSLRI